MLGVPSVGMPRGGLLCSKGGLEEKKQVSADSSGTWGLTAAPCFHVSPGRALWAPSSKHVHLQRNVNTYPFYLTLNPSIMGLSSCLSLNTLKSHLLLPLKHLLFISRSLPPSPSPSSVPTKLRAPRSSSFCFAWGLASCSSFIFLSL